MPLILNSTNADLLEEAACHPEPIAKRGFNPNAKIPYGLKVEQIGAAMTDFIDFLGFLNLQLRTKGLIRMESFLMQANFSSMVGEFMAATIPKHCPTLVKNGYHNGHPDLLPKGMFPNDTIQHAQEGIEIKGSRYLRGWQGHNAEDAWLMVFCFDSSRPVDAAKGILPKPFRFLLVCGARLEQSDWQFAGRSATSRRTITASVNSSGYGKMMANWIYRAPNASLDPEPELLVGDDESA